MRYLRLPPVAPRGRLVIVPFALALLACSGVMDDMKAKGDAAKAEGIAFAANKDQEGCIAEALVRATQQPELEFMYHAGNSVFLVSCLGAAAPVPGLCDGVPAPGEILDSVNWRIQACTARGYTDTDDQRCHRLLDGVQRHCHPDAE